MRIRTLIVIVAACAAAISGALAFRPAEKIPKRFDVTLEEYYVAALKAQAELDRFIPAKSVLLFGDSIVAGIDSSAISENAVNLAVPGNTTRGMIRQLRELAAVKRASAVILQGGINDMPEHSTYDDDIVADYRTMLGLVSPHVRRVFVVGVLPSRRPGLKDRIDRIDTEIRSACDAISICQFIVVKKLADIRGELDERLSRDDVHPNKDGTAILQTVISTALHDDR